MTRFGFFLFNILLLVSIYGLIYLNGASAAAIAYTMHNFSVPYMTLILLMCLISTVRWFMSHEPEIAKEIGTWAHALWLVPALTALALYLMGALGPHFWHELNGLSKVR